jgi:hypothetical protein
MTPRRSRARFALLLTATLAAAPAIAIAQPAELPTQIVTISGRAEGSRNSGRWVPVFLRDEIGVGDAVRTVGGRLTLLTASSQALRLGAKTQIAFGPSDAAAGAPTRVRMDGGILWVAAMPNNPPLEVKAGPVTLLTHGGGTTVLMNPDGSVLVAMYHGTATAHGEGWQRTLAQDQEVLVPPTGVPKEITKLKRDKSGMEWAKWNEQQDQAGGYGARVEK